MSMKLRVITINGWLDMDTPAEFHLPSYIMGIRAAGYILTDTHYIDGRYFVSAVLFDPTNPPAPPNQNVPAGSTLQ